MSFRRAFRRRKEVEERKTDKERDDTQTDSLVTQLATVREMKGLVEMESSSGIDIRLGDIQRVFSYFKSKLQTQNFDIEIHHIEMINRSSKLIHNSHFMLLSFQSNEKLPVCYSRILSIL